MNPVASHPYTGVPRIVVADEDPKVVALVVETLRGEGYAVFPAHDALSATRVALSLESCDLVISNTKVQGVAGVDLVHYLRQRMPRLPMIYLANIGRSTPEAEAALPADVPILREPFTAGEIRAHVTALLDHDGEQTLH
jgi:two-component system OmpR family response regulator